MKVLLAGLTLLVASPARADTYVLKDGSVQYIIKEGSTPDIVGVSTRDIPNEDRTVGSAVRDDPMQAFAHEPQLSNASDAWLAGVNREVNRKLWICRGC